jgi:branched-chain amino acid transport system substrate-binding protein
MWSRRRRLHRRAVWLAVALTVALAASACTGARTGDRAGEVRAVATTVPAPTAAGSPETAPPGAEPGDVGTGSVPTQPAPGTVGGRLPAKGPVAQGPVTPTTAVPAATGGFVSRLFRPDEDSVGITAREIRLCAHAALTYGAAFNTSADDLNVYWTALNEAGGIFGRSVKAYYENDNYTPTDAVKAATACKQKYNPFFLIGGIGFDQIPAVRTWAEQNRMLYVHHTATVNGSEGKQFSYTGLPTTEKVGEMFAELAAWRFPGKKVGIVKRQSENWEPGVVGFKRVAGAHGVRVVLERAVPQNKGSYLQDILELKNAGAEVVWVWLNALETVQFVKQSKAQAYSPQFMVFPFNLETQTLGDDALNPPLVGVAMWNAYSKGDYSGPFAAYADDMREFERQYAKYRPNADIGGVGGDLLFLNWSAQKALAGWLALCGRDCTRNRLVEVIHGLRGQATSSFCPVDFTRPGPDNDHRGGWSVSVLEAYRAPSGKVNLRNLRTCVEHLI